MSHPLKKQKKSKDDKKKTMRVAAIRLEDEGYRKYSTKRMTEEFAKSSQVNLHENNSQVISQQSLSALFQGVDFAVPQTQEGQHNNTPMYEQDLGDI
jgi:hypothetical protein